jgi:tRNA G18 (ribose-2'-O)-methylase SpoU
MSISSPITESPEEVRAVLAAVRNDLTVAVMTPGNAFATGAIIRTAHSFLVREIVLVGGAPHYEKASMGMHKYENIVSCADEGAFLAHVAGRPLWVVEKDEATTSLYAAGEFPRDLVLVFGSERFGVPRSIVARADRVVGIPIYGVNHSLPVAVAAGIALGEWARRRYREGVVV